MKKIRDEKSRDTVRFQDVREKCSANFEKLKGYLLNSSVVTQLNRYRGKSLNKRECNYVTRTTACSSLIFFRQNTPCDGTSTGQAIPLV